MELRRRLAVLAGTATAVAGPIRRPGLWRGLSSPAGRAIAAVLVLAIGVMAWQFSDLFLPADPISNPYHANAGLPETVAVAMVKKHDACCHLPDHHEYPDIPRTDFPKMAEVISTELGRPVLVADVGHGWQFQGAATCSVGSHRAGHVVFKKGPQELSVFSMPPIVSYASAASTYEMVTSDHPIAGFGNKSGLYCLVGSDPQHQMQLHDIVQLRDELRARSGMASSGSGCSSSTVLHVAHRSQR